MDGIRGASECTGETHSTPDLAIGSLGAWISGRLFRRKWSREEQLHDAMSLTR